MSKTKIALFAAGCFWDIEETFRGIPGVVSVTVGFTGGFLESPSYKQVCTDRTGHAESVQVVYDPSQIGFDGLLEVFWRCHDPTTLNRQGVDVGTQYRSAIFWQTREEEEAALASKQAHAHLFTSPIVTEVTPATPFYPAEEFHQRYLAKLRSHDQLS